VFAKTGTPNRKKKVIACGKKKRLPPLWKRKLGNLWRGDPQKEKEGDSYITRKKRGGRTI